MSTTENVSQTHPNSWDKSYLLDIDMIDKQHIMFFKIFDRLLELNNQEDVQNEILEVITELDKYTHNHFATEEALMRNANASEFESHVTQHKVFISKIEDFKIAYQYKNTVLLEQMISFMRKWFLIHISEIDRKYVEPVKKYLIERESKKNSAEEK